MARSHGSGQCSREDLAACGEGVVIEPGALIFHPEHVELGRDVYVGHYAILKGYHQNRLQVGDGCWIGQLAFLHAAGGLRLGRRVGVGPGVKILTSAHEIPEDPAMPILDAPIRFGPVTVEDGADLGVGAILLPGIRIGRGAQVGAGAVVTRDVPPGAIVSGVPARVVSER